MGEHRSPRQDEGTLQRIARKAGDLARGAALAGALSGGAEIATEHAAHAKLRLEKPEAQPGSAERAQEVNELLKKKFPGLSVEVVTSNKGRTMAEQFKCILTFEDGSKKDLGVLVSTNGLLIKEGNLVEVLQQHFEKKANTYLHPEVQGNFATYGVTIDTEQERVNLSKTNSRINLGDSVNKNFLVVFDSVNKTTVRLRTYDQTGTSQIDIVEGRETEIKK